MLSWWEPPADAGPAETATGAAAAAAAAAAATSTATAKATTATTTATATETGTGAGGRPRCPDRLYVAFTAARPIAAGEALIIHARSHRGHTLVENTTFAARCRW